MRLNCVGTRSVLRWFARDAFSAAPPGCTVAGCLMTYPPR